MLYKAGSSTECGNYRTIALISHASKVLLIIILHRMRKKAEEELSDCQAGYRSNRGTTDMLFILQIMTEKIRNSNQEAFITFIDYSKATDGFPESPGLTHSRTLLRSKSNHKMEWRSLWIFWHKERSYTSCILSPHLFNLYTEQVMRKSDIDDIGIKIGGRNITNLRYADDTALLADNITSMSKKFTSSWCCRQQCRFKTKCQKDQSNAHYRARKSRFSTNKNKWNRFGKLGIMIMCPSESTCLSADCCFADLAL